MPVSPHALGMSIYPLLFGNWKKWFYIILFVVHIGFIPWNSFISIIMSVSSLCLCLSIHPVCVFTCLSTCCYVLESIQSMDSSDLSDGPITLQEYLEVKKALASSEAKVQQLMKVNNNLSEELRRLQKEVGSTRRGRKSLGTKYANKVRISTTRRIMNTKWKRKQKIEV